MGTINQVQAISEGRRGIQILDSGVPFFKHPQRWSRLFYLMASDFWSSTQNTQWRHTKSRLQDWQDGLAKEDVNLIRQYPLPDNRLLSIYLQQQIAKLGKRFQVHQPILGTAMIFVRRFYLKIQIRKTNPYLLLVTAFYLACKVEETPHHIKTILTEARHLWSGMNKLNTACQRSPTHQ